MKPRSVTIPIERTCEGCETAIPKLALSGLCISCLDEFLGASAESKTEVGGLTIYEYKLTDTIPR